MFDYVKNSDISNSGVNVQLHILVLSVYRDCANLKHEFGL